MNYSDRRGKRVLFVGNCLLNQNIRGFGAAVTEGVFADLMQVLVKHGIGIEQLPCPECLVWGGIRRRSLYRWQPFVFNSVGKWWFPVLQFFIRLNIFLTHTRVSKREAKKAVDWMADHMRQGFEVVGVVMANDSPTCGVTKTIDLFDVLKQARTFGMTLDDLENPRIEKIKPFTQFMLVDGSGAFGGAIVGELRKRQMDIPVIGWDLWEKPEEEATRIAELLRISP